MALLLDTVSDSGATGSYWRIIHCSLDAANKSVRVAVALYLDENARKVGSFPLMVRQYAFEYDPFVADENAVRVAYDSITALQEFSGAIAA